MKLIRYQNPLQYTDPFAEMDRFFEETFGRLTSASRNGNGDGRIYSPQADIYADDANYYLRIELPGVSREELTVETVERGLTIGAKRVVDGESAEESFHYRREFHLPEDVDAAQISARLENGLLEVTLPKAEEARPRTIEIN